MTVPNHSSTPLTLEGFGNLGFSILLIAWGLIALFDAYFPVGTFALVTGSIWLGVCCLNYRKGLSVIIGEFLAAGILTLGSLIYIINGSRPLGNQQAIAVVLLVVGSVALLSSLRKH